MALAAACGSSLYLYKRFGNDKLTPCLVTPVLDRQQACSYYLLFVIYFGSGGAV